MQEEEPKVNLIPWVEIYFLDGDKIPLKDVEFQTIPLGVAIVEKDKPGVTRIFPLAAIKELRIPGRVIKKKIIGVQGQPFGGG